MVSAVTVKTFWDAPAVLQAPLRAVFKPAVYELAAAMAAVHPKTTTMKVLSVTDTVATIKGGGLASMWEHGRSAGYNIYPKAVAGFRRSYSRKHGIGVVSWKNPSAAAAGGSGAGAIKFPGDASGHMAAFAIGGKMEARPFMMPLASRFQADFYNPLARAAISRSTSSLIGKIAA